MSDAAVEIVSDLARLDFAATSALIRASYWALDRTDADNRRAFDNSVCVSALVDGRQVGFARASGDRAVFARISDVIVWPGHRGQGIGKALVAALLSHPELATVTVWSLVTDDAQRLYEKFGFEPVPADGRTMQMKRDAAAGPEMSQGRPVAAGG